MRWELKKHDVSVFMILPALFRHEMRVPRGLENPFRWHEMRKVLMSGFGRSWGVVWGLKILSVRSRWERFAPDYLSFGYKISWGLEPPEMASGERGFTTLRVEAWHDGAMRFVHEIGWPWVLVCQVLFSFFQPCWVAPLGPCFCVSAALRTSCRGVLSMGFGALIMGPSSPRICDPASASVRAPTGAVPDPQRDFKESFSLMSCDKNSWGGELQREFLTKLRSDFSSLTMRGRIGSRSEIGKIRQINLWGRGQSTLLSVNYRWPFASFSFKWQDSTESLVWQKAVGADKSRCFFWIARVSLCAWVLGKLHEIVETWVRSLRP